MVSLFDCYPKQHQKCRSVAFFAWSHYRILSTNSKGSAMLHAFVIVSGKETLKHLLCTVSCCRFDLLLNTCRLFFSSFSAHSPAYSRVAGESLTSSREYSDFAILPEMEKTIQWAIRGCCLFFAIRLKPHCETIT